MIHHECAHMNGKSIKIISEYVGWMWRMRRGDRKVEEFCTGHWELRRAGVGNTSCLRDIRKLDDRLR